MSDMNGKPRFRLSLVRTEIVIEDRNNQEIECYVQELDGMARDEYVNLSLSRSKVDRDTGVRTGYDVKDLEANLVHKCLFKADGTKFTFKEVQEFPASTLTGLYRMCEELNGINQRGKETVKNA